MNAADNTENTPDTRTAIMEATYAALCKHGYANLTMQAIADEFDKTKAVLHYHYDTKEDLLVAFLDYLLDRFLDTLDIETIDDPEERLVALVDALLLGTHEPRSETDHWEYHTALLDIRAQAPHNDAFREQLTTNYRHIEATAAAIIEDGIERGVFREVDPERAATWLFATINGARLHQVTLDESDVAEDVRAAIVEEWLDWLRRPNGE
ncbi:TetR/AcrR family transcriptional regulator [Halorussus amylolyticus]|uniref:TetR/AcrR family transcriptional regulator n=1 Tax=Halorussus amylolyticus TaxID=1126242 RepID=UPI001044280D|nr:TetR/AcrR family transcriptional regulator [Halorussus amylolyticus]